MSSDRNFTTGKLHTKFLIKKRPLQAAFSITIFYKIFSAYLKYHSIYKQLMMGAIMKEIKQDLEDVNGYRNC